MQPDCYICTCTKSNGRGLEALERGCVTLRDNVMFLDVLVFLFVMPTLSLDVGRGDPRALACVSSSTEKQWVGLERGCVTLR